MKPWKFKPFEELDVEIPKENRREALQAASDYLREAMLDYIGEGKSPVSGFGKFPGYTKKYRNEKGELSSSSTVNLELTGEMLDALDVKVSGNNLMIGVFGDADVKGKAEGNNLGTYGQSSPIKGKARRFIPVESEGESLKRDILQGLKRVLKEFEDGPEEE